MSRRGEHFLRSNGQMRKLRPGWSEREPGVHTGIRRCWFIKNNGLGERSDKTFNLLADIKKAHRFKPASFPFQWHHLIWRKVLVAVVVNSRCTFFPRNNFAGAASATTPCDFTSDCAPYVRQTKSLQNCHLKVLFPSLFLSSAGCFFFSRALSYYAVSLRLLHL